MKEWNVLRRKLSAIGAFFLALLCSYGELVLQPVTIAERALGDEFAISPTKNKK